MIMVRTNAATDSNLTPFPAARSPSFLAFYPCHEHCAIVACVLHIWLNRARGAHPSYDLTYATYGTQTVPQANAWSL